MMWLTMFIEIRSINETHILYNQRQELYRLDKKWQATNKCEIIEEHVKKKQKLTAYKGQWQWQ